MLCAHTVRRLKPGSAEQVLEAFRPRGGQAVACGLPGR